MKGFFIALIILCTTALFCAFTLGWVYGKTHPDVNIDLPEKYRLIKATDTLKGYWQQDTLHIEFNNLGNN